MQITGQLGPWSKGLNCISQTKVSHFAWQIVAIQSGVGSQESHCLEAIPWMLIK